MDKFISIAIWIFIYSLFWNIINNVLYYAFYIVRLMFEFMYYWGSLMQMSNFWATLINITFYWFIFFSFRKFYNLIFKN